MKCTLALALGIAIGIAFALPLGYVMGKKEGTEKIVLVPLNEKNERIPLDINKYVKERR